MTKFQKFVNQKLWKCPYCLTVHNDSYVRCAGCHGYRADRMELNSNGEWLAADPTDGHSKIGCMKHVNKVLDLGEK